MKSLKRQSLNFYGLEAQPFCLNIKFNLFQLNINTIILKRKILKLLIMINFV